MRLKIAQVVGLNTDQQAAQVVSSQREDPSAASTGSATLTTGSLRTGSAFIAVLLLSSDDAFTLGRQILSELEDFYFEFEGGAADKLKATFTETESKIPRGAEFSLCLAAISNKVLYMIGKGQVEVYLKRSDQLSPLLSAAASSQLLSGFISPGDRILFATTSLISFLGSDLEKSVNLPIETFEEEIGGKIGVSDVEDQGLAALLVEIAEEKPEIAALSTPSPDQNLINRPPAVSQPILGKVMMLVGYLQTYFPKSNRARLAVALVLMVMIILGAGYKYKSSRGQLKQQQFNQALQEARNDFDSAKGLAGLNPTEAKNKLDSAKDKVNKALALMPKNNSAEDLKKQVEQESSSILQQSSVADFPIFLDMDLVKKNFHAAYMSLSAGKLLLLDPGVKTLVIIDLAKKSNQILAGSEQLGDAAFFSLNGGMAFVYSKDKGVLRIDTTNQKLAAVAKKDSSWEEIKDLYAFAGNIYLLDTGQVWKYLPTSDGYSDKREYLSKDAKADFGNAVRMQIESSIYILKNKGEILRFTRGDKDNFSLSGLDKGVKDPKSFFTSSDTDNLYVLDSGNSRLLILTKTGEYKGQIMGSKFGTAADLAVDEAGKKVYLLEGSKIYSVDLK